MRVLIVEDEYLLALDAQEALGQAGCEMVSIASSVTKALSMLAEGAFDAALVDANLQGESSEPIATALHQHSIPFLVVSGYSASQLPGSLAGAPFLAKPYGMDALVAATLALKASKRGKEVIGAVVFSPIL